MWALFPPVELAVQQHNGPRGAAFLPGRGRWPASGLATFLTSDAVNRPSEGTRPGGHLGGRPTKCLPRGSLGTMWKGADYRLPGPGRACPPCPPSPTCCWRTRRWRRSSCPSRSPPRSASPSRSGLPAPPAHAPGLPRGHGLLPRGPHGRLALPRPLPLVLPPLWAQGTRCSLVDKEVKIIKGISWKGPMGSGPEVDCSALSAQVEF